MAAPPARPRRRLAAVVLAAALPLAACGQDPPVAAEGTAVPGGNPAPDTAVTEDLNIAALQIPFPDGGLWPQGTDVPLYAAITNTASTADRLVDVRGPDFADARLVDRNGTAGAIDVPENNNVYLEPAGPPTITLLNIGRSLRSSQSIQVTFVFERAGEVTMEAPVAADSPANGTFTTPQDPTRE